MVERSRSLAATRAACSRSITRRSRFSTCASRSDSWSRISVRDSLHIAMMSSTSVEGSARPLRSESPRGPCPSAIYDDAAVWYPGREAPDGGRRRRLRAVRGGLLADSGQISEVKVEPASGPEDSAQPDAELSWAERKSLHFEIRKTQTAAAPLTQPETAPAECTLRHRRTPRRCSRRSSAPM